MWPGSRIRLVTQYSEAAERFKTSGRGGLIFHSTMSISLLKKSKMRSSFGFLFRRSCFVVRVRVRFEAESRQRKVELRNFTFKFFWTPPPSYLRIWMTAPPSPPPPPPPPPPLSECLDPPLTCTYNWILGTLWLAVLHKGRR